MEAGGETVGVAVKAVVKVEWDPVGWDPVGNGSDDTEVITKEV